MPESGSVCSQITLCKGAVLAFPTYRLLCLCRSGCLCPSKKAFYVGHPGFPRGREGCALIANMEDQYSIFLLHVSFRIGQLCDVGLLAFS